MLRKILIVDDNNINRQLLVNVLKNEYDIVEAENGKEALNTLQSNNRRFSAVLLDVVMPEMDGYSVLSQIKEETMLNSIPVLMITGANSDEARAKALTLGASDFITKPFNPEIVKHCLKNNILMCENASIINAIKKDMLTGVYSREVFFEKASIMIKNNDPGYYVLSSFDIDNFKIINDQYGSIEGDNILKEVASIVDKTTTEAGGIVGRISGDNFVSLLPKSRLKDSILEVIKDKIPALREQRYLAFSIGRYIITDIDVPVSTLYDRACLAKQSVKGKLDNKIRYFDETMLQKLVRDQQILSEMEQALRENQFEVWFQPQYNHGNGNVVGSEALVRWNHPKKGIIPPCEFIPLFEKNGFIYEMDKYVWRETCKCLRKWLDSGMKPAPVSVNVSRYDLFRADIVATLCGYREEFDIPASLLRLEITESAFVNNTEIIINIVKQLEDKGFLIEIDDFGSGYSSLNILKDVPAQIVKLDMRFLQYGDGEKRGGTILESVVRMAKWLGMYVIAEGVETKKQGDFLKSIGCSNIQGFLYAKPMEAEKYEKLLKKTKIGNVINPAEDVDMFGNGDIWNPQSIDSLVFNSYVGAACMLEVSNGKIEIIRATDKFAQMIGGETMTVNKLMQLDFSAHFDSNCEKNIIKRIEASAEKMNEISDEFILVDIPNCPHKIFIRSNMRVVANVDNRHLVYCISENITAQRESEHKERKIANQLQAVLDNIYCGITASIITDSDINLVFANDHFYELIGYEREEFFEKYGNNPFDAIYEADRDSVRRNIIKTTELGDTLSMEYRALRKNGEVVWIRSLLSTTSFDDIDSPVQLCTFVDISSEKNITEKLIDNLPCGAGICTIKDGHATMTYLNRKYYKYFKHNEGREKQEEILELVHPNDYALLKETMWNVYNKGGEGSCIARFQDGPDNYITLHVAGATIDYNEYNSSTNDSLYVTFVPVSQEELSFNETLFIALEKMMMSSSDYAFVKDKNLKYICCSKSYAKMMGLNDTKEVIGKTDYDFFDLETAKKYTSENIKLISTGQSIIDKEEMIPSVDGKSRCAKTSKYILTDSRDEVVGIYGVGHDVTKSHDIEAKQKFLMENIPGGFAVFEIEWPSFSNGKVAYFSEGLNDLFGYTKDEYKNKISKDIEGIVDPKYLQGFIKQIKNLVENNVPIDYVYRVKTKKGSEKWMHAMAVIGEKTESLISLNTIILDVTAYQRALEDLRISEEEKRLALSHTDNVVCKYSIEDMTLILSRHIDPKYNLPRVVKNVPYGQVEKGEISSETASVYINFYESIIHGSKKGNVVFKRKSLDGWHWIEAFASTIFNSDNRPSSAVISFKDVTESYEKEIAYKTWLHSLHKKNPDTYTLYRCNVTKGTVYDSSEGLLHKSKNGIVSKRMDACTEVYLEKYVHPDDRETFNNVLKVELLKEKYKNGERNFYVDFRDKAQDNKYKWCRVTIDMVQYPHSHEIEAIVLFEDIDKTKRKELMTIERAKFDALTSALNRRTFSSEVAEAIDRSGKGTKHAFIMLDIDNFKQVNDTFGHSEGDKMLIEIVDNLKSILRRGDIVGRLGGDEFIIFLQDISEQKVAEQKAEQIRDALKRDLNGKVRISASIGIAMYPDDGYSFDTLYEKADEAMYHIKYNDKNNYAFYSSKIESNYDPKKLS